MATTKKPTSKAGAKKAPAKKTTTKKVATAKKATAKKPAAKEEPKKVESTLPTVETTGHEWDGIKEYNNPLPRWWVWVFLATVVWAVGYVIYYPAIPLTNGFTKGTAEWSQYKELEEAKAKASEAKASFEAGVNASTAEEIIASDELYSYTVASGQALFALHCSQCHGRGAAGAKGYPSLVDDEWIWGGSIEDIITTIKHGIRSYDDDNTRDMGAMMAYGKDEILTPEEISDVVSHLFVISGKYQSGEASDRGEVIYAENCTACHGENGEGNQELGAPGLNNQIWLYGGTREELIETIHGGRAGMMPAFGEKFTEEEIKKLAIYVHSLTGGEQ